MDEKELAELDLAVAKAEGLDTFGVGDQLCAVFMRAPNGTALKYGPYQPTRDPAEAMRLLQKYQIALEWEDGMVQASHGDAPYTAFSRDPMVAICQVVVALKQRQE